MLLRLVLRHIGAHPARSALTAGSVAVAVTLMCVLQGAVLGIESAVTVASKKRLWVQSAVSLYVGLPLSYESKIRAVPGVETVSKFQWFGGVYQDPSNFFAQFGVDPEHLLTCYPEMEIVQGSMDEFLSDRTGCVVGADLATKHGWELGQSVPIEGTIYPRLDGSPWEFTIRAIYSPKKPSLDGTTLYFDFAYLQESIEAGAVNGASVEVGTFVIAMADGADPEPIMATVDGMFENGPQRVQTTTEAEFARQFMSMLGNVPLMLSSIGGAILFAVFFAVLNTMLSAGRERIRTIGVIKALGFTRGFAMRLLVVESLLVCGIGGAVGAGAAHLLEPGMRDVFAAQIQAFAIPTSILGIGFSIALGVGLIAGLAPGLSTSRLTPVEALRSKG